MEDGAIECEGLRRTYPRRRGDGGDGDVVALDRLDLTVPRGGVFGLLGPNGAGKTTLIRILATILVPTTGSARVLGLSVVDDARAVRQRIGLVLGGERGLFGQLSARDNLRYYASLHGIGARSARRRITELAAMFQLGDFLDRRIEQCSRGMRQRVHLARGLLTRPELLYLDEPTIGLDPVGADELREMVPVLAAAGTTVLLSTHYMSEADRLCDEVMILDRGRCVARGTPSLIRQAFSRVEILEATVPRLSADTLTGLRALDAVTRVVTTAEAGDARITIHLRPDTNPHDAVRAALSTNGDITLTERSPTLEEAYLSIFDTPA